MIETIRSVLAVPWGYQFFFNVIGAREKPCGQEIYQKLWEMNALDLELVEFATIEIRGRRDRIPTLSRKGTGMTDS